MRQYAPMHRPTISDVAVLSGVSRATVSRVLNGRHWVSPAAQAAVDSAVLATGYIASHSARSLSTGRSGAVGLIIGEGPDRLFDDPGLAATVSALSACLTARDLTLYLTLVTTDVEREAVLAHAAGGLLDGVILRSIHGDDPLFGRLLKAKVPAVVFGEPLGAGRAIPHVKIGDRAGARRMADHLLEGGRVEIALITGPLDTASAQNRLAGVRDVLADRLRDDLVIATPAYSTLAGYRAMQDLLTRRTPIDAVFAASDVLASGALIALREAGLRVPTDVALAGFDDSTLAAQSDPPLTTVHTPYDRQAGAVVDMLIRVIAGEAPRSKSLPTRLVRRSST